MLILATGFRVHDYFAPMEIFGLKSEDILKKWKAEGPSGYLGTTSSCMPNHFMLLGPGSVSLHTNLYVTFIFVVLSIFFLLRM